MVYGCLNSHFIYFQSWAVLLQVKSHSNAMNALWKRYLRVLWTIAPKTFPHAFQAAHITVQRNSATAHVLRVQWVSLFKEIWHRMNINSILIYFCYLNNTGMNGTTVTLRMCLANETHLVGTCKKINVQLLKRVTAEVCFCDTDGCNIGSLAQSNSMTLILVIFCFIKLMNIWWFYKYLSN